MMTKFRCGLRAVVLLALIMGLAGFPVAWADLNDGLVAYYPFDGNANDESGRENDGTVYGATLVEDRFEKADSAYNFDGDDDYIAVSNAVDLLVTQAFTVSVWINKNEPGQDRIVGLFQSEGNSEPIYGMLNSSEKIRMQVKDETNNWDNALNLTFSNTEISLNSWHHLVFTFNKPNYEFYLDSILDGSGSWDNEVRSSDINPYLYIASRGDLVGFEFFHGAIDDIRIYNRALSKCEIKSLYTGKDECLPLTASCQLYAVQDTGLNNTQFFTISPETFEVKALGDMKKAHDIEALDTHPQTAKLFAASGKETKKPGYLYSVDKNTGQLTDIGATGFQEIDGLSFHPDGTLWGWATGDGLVTIDTNNGQAKLVAAYPGEVEDITWNTAGTILFGVENVQNDPDAGIKLLAYDGKTIKTVCEELTQSLEIEAMDTLPDDTLIFGLHAQTSLPLGVVDVTHCQIIAAQKIATNYNDVEGIAWPTPTCGQNPSWLMALIEELSTAPVANPPAKIIQYTYNNATVYFLPERCCDIMSILYDVNGNIICHPSGGIAGIGDGRCPDFFDSRTDEVLIWQDERGSKP